jgi:hypothetical protein
MQQFLEVYWRAAAIRPRMDGNWGDHFLQADFALPNLCCLFLFFAFRTLSAPRMLRQSALTQGKSVTFGVTRGCIAVAAPVSSITWLMPP